MKFDHETGITLCIVALTVAIVVGLAIRFAPTEKQPPFVTIEHDGHMWIKPRLNEKSLTHHPDCPCRHQSKEP